MILIERGREPESLLQFRKKNPGVGYEELEREPRIEIRKQLWEEQRGLCAYCMRQIKDARDVRIEHYEARHPQKGEYRAENTLDYKKMLGVCYGNSIVPGRKKENKTCDAHRENIPLTVNPFEVRSIRKIKYTSDGYIASDDKEIRKDLVETLNLNCHVSSLPENRKNVLLQAKKEIQKKCAKKGHDAYQKVLRQIYDRYAKKKQLIPYCGIIIAWLEKELKINEK